MQNRRHAFGWIFFAAAGLLGATGATDGAPKTSKTPSSTRVKPQRGSTLQKGTKPTVQFSTAAASSQPPIAVANLDNSMKKRRDLGWSLVDEVWKPVAVPGDDIPLWMTWYEQEDIEALYRDMTSRSVKLAKPSEIQNAVNETIARHKFKDLQASLHSSRLRKVLRQFDFPNAVGLGPNRKPSTGSIYYNPAYVKHFLANAARIAACDPSAYPKPEATRVKGPLTIKDVPAELRPADSTNHYALCMEQEMPPDAVVIKVAWTPVVVEVHSSGSELEYVQLHQIDLSDKMAAKLEVPPAGEWIEMPFGTSFGGAGTQAIQGFQIADEEGNRWRLVGMHIVAKRVPTWIWVTLFARGWPWNADMPKASAFRDWNVFMDAYGMAAVSNFKEGDSAPWQHYVGKGVTNWEKDAFAELVDTLKAVSEVMNGAQWGSNPYIETNMARGNCIGCHQGTPESFLPVTTRELQSFNVSDFSFAFTSNRASIRAIVQQNKAARKHRGSGK